MVSGEIDICIRVSLGIGNCIAGSPNKWKYCASVDPSLIDCNKIPIKSYLFLNDYIPRIKQNLKRVKKLPKIKGIKEIMYPGQNKYKRFKINSKKEIKLSDNIKRDLEVLNN